MTVTIGRRELLAALGGAAAAWPLTARAQQPTRIRRLGVLLNLSENDVEAQRLVKAFGEGLAQLGWADGRNLRIDYRWAGWPNQNFRKGLGRAVARHHGRLCHSFGGSTTTGDSHHPHRVPVGHRPGWPRPCRELGTSGR